MPIAISNTFEAQVTSAGNYWPAQNSVAYTPAVRNRNPAGQVVAAGRGFGMDTRHAYTTDSTPDIIHIESTDDGISNSDATHGTLKWALESLTQPRIIVFDVAGKFTINDQVTISGGDLWVAGQTAPGPVWIEITDSSEFGRPIRVQDGNMFWQHVHIWNNGLLTEQTNGVLIGAAGSSPSNMVFDHCFVGGATDQCFDYIGGTNLTLIDTMIALPQGKDTLATGHTVGETNHAYGGIWEGSGDVSCIGLVFARCYRRGWLWRDPSGTMCNVLSYGSNGDQLAFQGRDGDGALTIDVNVVGYRSINDSGSGPIWFYPDYISSSTYNYNTNSQVYLNDNHGRGYDDVTGSDEWDLVDDDDNQEADIRSNSVVSAAWPSGLVAAENRSRSEADYITLMTQNIGPNPSSRLSFVQDVIDDIINGTGSQQDAYTSPTISTTNSAFVFEGTPGNEHNPGVDDANRTQIEEQILDAGEEPLV